MSTQPRPDPASTLNRKWSFIPARQKSARHRIGPGVEAQALDLLLGDAAAQLAEENDLTPDTSICRKCGGLAALWDSSRIYPQGERRVVHRCISCGRENPLPFPRASANEVERIINRHFDGPAREAFGEHDGEEVRREWDEAFEGGSR